MNKFLFPLALIIIVGGVFFIVGRRPSGDAGTRTTETSVPDERQNDAKNDVLHEEAAVCPVESADFSKTGILARNNPGLEKDVWYLIYEGPGKPAQNTALKLADCSACTVAGADIPCEELSLSNGTRVTVTGVSQGTSVLVRTLAAE